MTSTDSTVTDSHLAVPENFTEEDKSSVTSQDQLLMDKNTEESKDKRNDEKIPISDEMKNEEDIDKNVEVTESPGKRRKKSSKKRKSSSKKDRSSRENDVEVTAEINVTEKTSDSPGLDGATGDENRSPDVKGVTENDNKIPVMNGVTGDENSNTKEEERNGKKAEENKPTEKVNGAAEINDEITRADTVDSLGFAKMTGQEELDALSQLSFKEQKDFKYYFQHPFLRLFIAYFVTFCNFLIYAEDPVAHSLKECNIPMVGNDFAFVCMRYPSNAWSLLKVVLWIAGIITGMIIGKLLVHKLLFCRLLRLKMFSEDQGSWMIMFLITLLSVFIFSWLYNAFLLAGGDSTTDYRISGLMGLTNSIFMKAAACGTWCGDFFTAWMVTDMMLQEKLYPYWARPVRRWWNRKFNRIILFWIVTSLTSFAVVFTIATDYIQWDKLHRDFLSSNELSRSFLASFILVMDILIVVQDWDFPHFISAIDIKLPGINTAHIKFDIPKCFRPEKWQVHITGKWFNYGILFLVMILDLNMWKNQIFYAPYDYGQYVDNEGRIHTVKDTYSLENHNETLLSFAYRNSTINPLTNQTYISEDSVMNSRYYNYSLGVKAIAFIPSIAAFITFGLLIYNFGRFRPTKEDPYAGRLLKRPKLRRKVSFKLFKESLRKKFAGSKFNKVKAVPKLLAFTRRRHTDKNSADYPENDRPPTDPV